jgi:hypothetical protein
MLIADFHRNSISTRINRISLTPSNSSTPSRDEMKRREARLKRFQESTKVKRTPTPSPATPATPNPVSENDMLSKRTYWLLNAFDTRM